ANTGPGGPQPTSSGSGASSPAAQAAARAASTTPKVGGQWGWLNPNYSSRTLFGLSCASTSFCASVGEGGEARYTSNGGAHWNPVNTGPGPLFAVSCPTVATCYATGLSGEVIRTTNK